MYEYAGAFDAGGVESVACRGFKPMKEILFSHPPLMAWIDVSSSLEEPNLLPGNYVLSLPATNICLVNPPLSHSVDIWLSPKDMQLAVSCESSATLAKLY